MIPCLRSSIINHQSSIINHQSSIINHQSSIINNQSSIINQQSGAKSRVSFRFPRRRRPFIPSTAIRSFPSLSGHPTYRWRSLPRFRRRRASSSQDRSSNGCCIFMYHHGEKSVRFLFPDPLLVVVQWTFAIWKISEGKKIDIIFITLFVLFCSCFVLKTSLFPR